MCKYLAMICTCFICFFSLSPLVDANTSSRKEYEQSGKVVWEVNSKEKLVALTFDDGPNPIYTAQILELLAKYEAKATFFVTGRNASRYPQLIQRTVKEGHEIGNHTFHHDYNPRVSATKLSHELDRTAQIVEKITGKQMTLYRPAGGFYSDTIIETAAKKGYLVVMWSWRQDPKDWLKPSAQKISQHVLTNLRAGDIVLLHDSGGNRRQTVKALDIILKKLTQEGYRCVTVTNLMYRTQILEQDDFHIFPQNSI